MAMGHKRGQPGETPTNSQKPPPGFIAPGRSDRLPCPARCPRWAPWNGAAGDRHTGRGGEEKSPRCFDHCGPAASLTGDGNGAKHPQQKGAPRPAWAEPQEDHPPHSTLTLEIKGWRSPMGHRGLDFPARGSCQAGRRLLLARVCSSKVVRGCRGRAGLVASLHGKRSACRAKRGKLALLPQGCSRALRLSWTGQLPGSAPGALLTVPHSRDIGTPPTSDRQQQGHE
ncbi:uncharacterized protein LOC128148201 isoform X2 [Harpia harpyja]|uniref:uncharacterized protein LOC128148201 isoform X2 n=1 Tax=Harpia harpyja TaxID=202280 RepID=UPI0022B167CB|nr:uncharacterized protein LOC128148201 isoform X2 [Harpia harpyja]